MSGVEELVMMASRGVELVEDRKPFVNVLVRWK